MEESEAVVDLNALHRLFTCATLPNDKDAVLDGLDLYVLMGKVKFTRETAALFFKAMQRIGNICKGKVEEGTHISYHLSHRHSLATRPSYL